jgi:alkyl hydroperoxide reductase subunit D
MSIENLKNQIGDFAKDTRINLSNVISEKAAGLEARQVYGTALASAYATKNKIVVAEILDEVKDKLGEADINAAKAAASIMAMNNIFYRFNHLVSDKEYSTMPAGLRMQVIGNPGVEKVDFELYALAVSAINGCGACIDSHEQTLVKHGLSKQGVQSGIKIAAVIFAAAQAIEIA